MAGRLPRRVGRAVSHALYSIWIGLLDAWFLLVRCRALIVPGFRLWAAYLLVPTYSLGPSRREFDHLLLDKDELTYGETPYRTAHAALELAGVRPGEQVVDLGCGRGRVVLTAAVAFGARARGIEIVTPFVEVGNRIVEVASVDGLRFERGDLRDAELDGAAVVYINGTCLSEWTRQAVAERLAGCPPGLRICSVSAPLSHPGLTSGRYEELPFSWGWDRLYLQQVR